MPCVSEDSEKQPRYQHVTCGSFYITLLCLDVQVMNNARPQQFQPATVPTGLPEDLDSLIRDCLAHEPSERPTFQEIHARVNSISPLMVDDYFDGSRRQWQASSTASIRCFSLASPQQRPNDVEILHKVSAWTHPLQQQKGTPSCALLLAILLMGAVTIYTVMPSASARCDD